MNSSMASHRARRLLERSSTSAAGTSVRSRTTRRRILKLLRGGQNTSRRGLIKSSVKSEWIRRRLTRVTNRAEFSPRRS